MSFVEQRRTASTVVLSHIRHATQTRLDTDQPHHGLKQASLLYPNQGNVCHSDLPTAVAVSQNRAALERRRGQVMCELFAISSRFPVTVDLSLETFSRHGGLSGPHKDGWGIAYYEAGDVRLIKDTTAASQSPWVRFVEERRLRSRLVISHIRRATVGGVGLRNIQPFVRELGGHMHAFAHNGHCPDVMSDGRFRLGHYRPIGETDSEHAFCALLGRLQELWLSTRAVPPLAERTAIVDAFAADLRSLGPANFLYADSDALFAHAHRRRHEDAIRPPGLHVLVRKCGRNSDMFETRGLTIEADSQNVVLFASVPLTDEPWKPLDEGKLTVALNGVVMPERFASLIAGAECI